VKFGEIPTQDVLGAILAHSMEASKRPYDTQFSYRVPKGTVLTQSHIDDLEQEGHKTLVVAQLAEDDVEENQAAQTLAHAFTPDAETLGLRVSAAGAGRVNLYAMHCGVAVLDVDAIHAVNAVDPMITVATVAPFHRCDADTMIATIKIIAYGVPKQALADACVKAAQAIRVIAPQYASATLIETQVGRKEPADKGRKALFGRLQRMGMILDERQITPHSTEPLFTAIKEAAGEVIFILTDSATSDLMDVGPQALRKAGGHVIGFGMPVDPGNLLFFGYLGEKPVIGLPGCARSPALNGADWVLERLICGIKLTQADISAMGVGGLLKEIPTRPQPRAAAVSKA
jgi:molybdenum cofactor cytidylyltransferase|tara:strand:+ start:5500 stop:6531 length:1032 start_codon:yes stop_codon:yes gene_type:complete